VENICVYGKRSFGIEHQENGEENEKNEHEERENGSGEMNEV